MMEDRTIIIILASLNVLMWWFAIDFMIKTRRYIDDAEKRQKEYLLKNANYWHATFANVGHLVEMSAEAEKHFMEQIADIMSNEGTLNNEKENRK